MTDTLQAEFETLIAKQKKLQQEFQKKTQSFFKKATRDFFNKNPGITAILWTQYTPYFNDGEPCEFMVGEVYFTNASPKEMENMAPYGEYEGEDETVWSVSDIKHVMTSDSEWYIEIIDKINATGGVDYVSCELMTGIMSSTEMRVVMKEMFGDHVKIIATRDGFDVEEYEHE